MNILIVGASRGLGASLTKAYAHDKNHIFATSRSSSTAASAEQIYHATSSSSSSSEQITYIAGIDVAHEDAGLSIVKRIKPSGKALDVVIITAGYFATETFDQPNFDAEVQMYLTSAIGPVFIVHHLVKAGLMAKDSKIVLVSSESGSITLRHESEGGGNYGHHASKAALNMTGKLLSLDLKAKGIAVGIVHPGFMRTDMTKGVGFDKYWDAGGAVTPDEAAASLMQYISGLDMGSTGEYWAPRGPR
ncbi:MAG: hypothetical protein Q9195_000642 [Heterodermia aff. obscurata]